jgi:hypothetical protein
MPIPVKQLPNNSSPTAANPKNPDKKQCAIRKSNCPNDSSNPSTWLPIQRFQINHPGGPPPPTFVCPDCLAVMTGLAEPGKWKLV